MLKQASVHQLRTGEVTRKDGRIVVAMCFYPRGLRKELRDEYRSDLAPGKDLVKELQKRAKTDGHDEAFDLVDFAVRFRLSPEALTALEEIAGRSRSEDVYLVCQCELGWKCHRELLLLTARREFGAKIAPVFHDYPGFRSAPRPSKRAPRKQAARKK